MLVIRKEQMEAFAKVGLKKFEVSVDSDGFHFEAKAAATLDREFKVRAGVIKIIGEPSISFDSEGIKAELKLVGNAGPVSVGLKGIRKPNGELEWEPVGEIGKELFGLGGSLFGVGLNVGVEGGSRKPLKG